jgi:hypothetical protein
MNFGTETTIEDLFDSENNCDKPECLEDMEVTTSSIEKVEKFFNDELLQNLQTTEVSNVQDMLEKILEDGKEPIKKADYIGKYAPKEEKCYRFISIGESQHIYLDEYILAFRADMDMELLYYSDNILCYSESITETTPNQIVIPKTRTWNRVDVRFSNGEDDDYLLWAESHAVLMNIPAFAFRDNKGTILNPIREINVFQTKILVNSAIDPDGNLIESKVA